MATQCPKCKSDNPDTDKFCGECGTQLILADKADPSFTRTLETPVEDMPRGTLFADRYEIIENLGIGGMGEVYRVYDKKVEGEIALKLIKPEIASDKKVIERFRNELNVAREISHRNVCRMYDLGDAESRHFITMEYVTGEDLKSFIRRAAPLNTARAVLIAEQICEGLSEAHRLGVVHRDLKPSNIMIDKQGNVRIMDFGIARSLKAKGITRAGVMIGTPEYISPEQVEGKEVDQRVDIYSLGVILYEMVTGRVPFEGETALSVAHKHRYEAPQEPNKVNTQIPDDLSRVILRCLEKDKETRYQSAGEVRSELTRIEKGMPTTDRVIPERIPSTSKEITVTFRKRWLLIPILFVVLVVAVVAIRFLKQGKPVAPSLKHNILVVLPFENLGLPEHEYFADGITTEITSRLGALQELGVISRSSAIRYKKTEKTIKEIGEELGVDFVLEGTVRWDRSPEGRGRVLVTPEFIRVSDDIQLWSDRYDREIEDIFAVQSDIAEQVIRQLDITLLEPERRALKARPTDNLEAYQAYLMGIDYLMKPDYTEEQFRMAIQMFERAIKLDPNFALAFVGLTEALSVLAHSGYDLTEENISKAKAAADRVIELHPEMPEGHMALGFYYYLCHKDFDRALNELAMAEKDLPNNSRIPEHIGYILSRQGNFEESINNLKKAFELSPQEALLALELGDHYMVLRRYQEAERYYDRLISLAPDQMAGYASKASNYWMQGSLEKARATLEEMPKKTDPQSIRGWHKMWVVQEIFERNYQAALELLSSDFFEYSGEWKARYTGLVHNLMNEPELAHNSYDFARILLEKEVKEQPDDASTHSSLGKAYAGFGRKEEAIREGTLAVELHPISKDAYEGSNPVFSLAQIYVMVGEYEEALDKIEYLLSIPSHQISVPLLRLDPRWDPLREHPRFKRLLEKYSEDNS